MDYIDNLISIIVPVYNVEDYLEKCVDSILCQSYKELEIILIDDGSTDKSGKLCDHYLELDSRVVVIHQANKGLSGARNAGLDVAHGEYISFIDSDDWIESDFYEVLITNAKKFSADISSCQSTINIGKSGIDDKPIVILSSDEMIKDLLFQKYVRFEVWNKLWNHKLISETRFIEKQVCEDVHFNRLIFLRAKKMVIDKRMLHHYTVSRPGSTNSSFKKNKMMVFKEYESFINDLRLKNKTHLIGVVRTIACKFCVGLYVEAMNFNQDDKIRNTIAEEFNKFYVPIEDREYYTFKQKINFYMFSKNIHLFETFRKIISYLRKK